MSVCLPIGWKWWWRACWNKCNVNREQMKNSYGYKYRSLFWTNREWMQVALCSQESPLLFQVIVREQITRISSLCLPDHCWATLPARVALPMLQECNWCPTQCVFVKPWKWASMARMPLGPETGESCWSLSFTRLVATAAWCAMTTTLSASPSLPENSASTNLCPQKWRSSHLSTKVRPVVFPECSYMCQEPALIFLQLLMSCCHLVSLYLLVLILFSG